MDSTAITVQDFTSLSDGTVDESGARVHRCPRCGRSGLKVHGEAGDGYLHVQTSRIFGDGILTEPQDCCAGMED